VQVIGLSGYARSGKDTVARILVEQHGFTRVAYADALRDVALRVDPYVTTAGTKLSTIVGSYGWERAKDNFPEVRRLLQQLGVAVRDLVDTDAWVTAADRKMSDGAGRYVLPDMRFPNEIRLVRALGGLTVRVHRPGFGPVNGHISETALDNERFAYELHNAGTAADLRDDVAALVAFLEGRD
jgi:predicted Rdx family selenoprotein